MNRKFKIDDIKVKSFITEPRQNKIKGGQGYTCARACDSEVIC